jgi:hypothetical protein
MPELTANAAETKPPAHAFLGPPGWNCACGEKFDDYAALEAHVLRSIVCPHCGAAPAALGNVDALFRWTCGHWIARGNHSAAIRTDEPQRLP